MATRASCFCLYLCRAQALSRILPSFSPGTKHTLHADHRTWSYGERGHQRELRPGAWLPEAYNLVDYINLNSGSVLNSLQRCIKFNCKRWRNFSVGTLIQPWYFFTRILFPNPISHLPRPQTHVAILVKQSQLQKGNWIYLQASLNFAGSPGNGTHFKTSSLD